MSGIFVYALGHEDDRSTSSASFTHNFAPSNVLGQAILQGYYEAESQGGIDAHISQYVQNGTPYNVSYWAAVGGPNITSITYTLQVSDNAGRMLCRTDFL